MRFLSFILYKLRANAALHIILGFMLLSLMFCGIYSCAVAISISESIFACLAVRLLVRLFLLCDAFFSSLYRPLGTICPIFLLTDGFLWGCVVRTAYDLFTPVLKAVLFILFVICAAFYFVCILLFSDILADNLKTRLHGLSFSERAACALSTQNELPALLVCLSAETALNCVICAAAGA